MSTIYKVNKGINQTIEFKGLKAQYIWYLGGGIIVLMILFAALFITGLPSFACVGLIGILGTLLVIKTYALSRKYGEYGMMKALAKKQMPKTLKCYSRKLFIRQ
jgi:cadmium resistance protein CadD (predicted permease)